MIANYVTDETGIVHILGLGYGKYILREVETLEGLALTDEAIVIQVDENYVVQDDPVQIVNYPIIRTGTGIGSPIVWLGIGMLILATGGAGILLFRKKKEKA